MKAAITSEPINNEQKGESDNSLRITGKCSKTTKQPKDPKTCAKVQKTENLKRAPKLQNPVRKNPTQVQVKRPKNTKADDVQETDASSEKGPIACANCPQTFFTLHAHQKHQFKEHTPKGSNEDLKKCPLCSKKLVNKFNVIYHIKVVHDQIKPFKCAHCPKTFGAFAAKNMHELSHTDLFPHPCEFCDKRFRALGKLKQHLEVHTTKLELLCPICKRGKKSQEDLEIHMKSHRWQCSACGKIFPRKPTLDEHYNTVHLKLKPFKCKFCDRCYGGRQARRDHERRQHNCAVKRTNKLSYCK